ncbi:ABC transporter ATP-binding protein [Eremococcus coleocola]|uniref:ABC transporter, ATP-binding protein n=1 Tax=Eremococcus coleocola ACS-139-V-Col8 TaxID=908337 RepID=E4KPP9_9LACT|nr:ABC transporter ATP-binding protein [Eremococcus coleocola]EFR30957.1 ABC transporter, ATP-binding protein [Eremococcus coleocola ACS-139-V-Col8]
MNSISQKKKNSFSIKEQASILKYLFHFALNERKHFLISIIMMMITSGLTAYMPLIIQGYIDQYLAKDNATMAITIRIALTYLILLLIKMVVTYFKDYTFKLASEKTVAGMRNQIYSKVIHFSMDYFNKTPNGEVVSRVTNDTQTIKEFWNVFLTFFDGLINAIMVGVAMFSLNISMSWVFIAFIPLVFILIIAYQKTSTIVYGRMREALSRVNAQLSESTMGMWLIQQFNQSERMKADFDKINSEYVEARINMFRLDAALLMPAVNLIEQIVLVLVIWIFGKELLGGSTLDVGMIYAFTNYSKSFFHPIGQMIGSLSIYQDGLVAASRGIYLIDNAQYAPQANTDASDQAISGTVSLKNMTFSYNGKQDVLKNVSIEVKAGQMIALVGHTGSGKSTIINLLMRFYDYSDGDILIDGQSIRNLSQESLRRQIGLVHQDAFMFYGNFYDNIRLHGDYTKSEIEKAARFTGADSFIREQENGYETMVSEGGKSLSAGQRQLINITRTILRKPRILILDEATANIDTETEGYIQASLEKIRQECTLIVIAHRLSTIKKADRIYVMNKGRVIEQGQHDDLIDQEGTYYNMYQLQSLQGLS